MTKTIGYYCDNSHPAIAKLEEKYGCYLQGMKEDEKYSILVYLLDDVLDVYLNNPSNEVIAWQNSLLGQPLDEQQAISLVKALAASL